MQIGTLQMGKLSGDLPKFKNPPVIETVLSVQFPALKFFDVRHFGLLWEFFKDTYPDFSIQPLLPETTEQFGKPTGQVMKLELTGGLDPSAFRCWLTSKAKDKLIQIQRNRFLFNWRKTSESTKYPSYSTNRPSFEKAWKDFCRLVEQKSGELPRPNQCEVTYINHIDVPIAKSSGHGLIDFFPVWSGRLSTDFLPKPSSLAGHCVYDFEDNQGRLHIAFNPAVRASDGKEIVVLEITARGAPRTADNNDVLSWLDLGHEWVVKSFEAFTSPGLHEKWGKYHADA